MARGAAAAAGLGSCISPSVVVAAAAAAKDPSSPSLRSTFFAPSSSSSSFSPLKNAHFRRRRRHHHPSRKCGPHISASVNLSGMDTLHESMVQVHVGVLQRVVDLGFTLPANEGALSWPAIAVPAVIWYIAAAPGSMRGLLDYAYAPLHAASNISFDAEEVQVGRQIGQGSFGVVYEGYIGRGVRKQSQKEELHVVLKKAKPRSRGAAEMHNAEVHMNRRVQRTAPNACADFLGTTLVSSSQARGRLSEGLWLVWRYEGDRTLAHYMKQKNFPENVAESVLGSKVAGPSKQEIAEQSNAVIRKIATQILTSLRDLHKTGLVHRDVKPLNLILAEDSGTFKLIDLGAAVDLRSGYNYVPDETIIDPIYAAPERHVMPTSTPKLPPDPLCTLVSPLVWLLNTPDRFDLFSAGLVLLQLAVRPLRQDIGLQTFNAEYKRAGYNLDAWRRRCRISDEDFSLLDADGAAGWELVRSMLQPRYDKAFYIWPSLGSSRPSADAALRHRFLTGKSVKLPSFKALELPTLDLPLQPSNLIPSFSFDTLPNLEGLGAGLTMKGRQVFTAISDVIPSPQQLPTQFPVKLPSLKNLELPALSLPRQPSNLIPNVSFDTLPKLGALGNGLDINWKQVITSITAVLPSISSSALILATGWLVFSALRDSAQQSYAVGQWAVESLGVTVPICVASYVLGRLLLEAQKSTGSSSSNTDSKLRRSPRLSLAAAGMATDNMTVNDLPTSQLQHVKERVTLSGFDETLETSDRAHRLAGAEVESPTDAAIRKLLASRPQTLRPKRTKTGLAEAVQTMELQLASLESSIAAGRLFGQQQQEQIIQMEKLLIQQPQEAVIAAKQSGN